MRGPLGHYSPPLSLSFPLSLSLSLPFSPSISLPFLFFVSLLFALICVYLIKTAYVESLGHRVGWSRYPTFRENVPFIHEMSGVMLLK